MKRRVLFISDSSHKALRDEQRLLDRFLHRISDTVWAGLLSAEAEETLRHTFLKTRSPYRALLCIDAASLRPIWHIGRKRRLLPDGRQAIADRTLDIPQTPWPEITIQSKTITEISALFHDIGKATNFFQSKLRTTSRTKISSQNRGSTSLAEPFRHQFLSTLALLRISTPQTIQDPTRLRELIRAVAQNLLPHQKTDLNQAKNCLEHAWNASEVSPVLQAARVIAAHHGPLQLAIDDLKMHPIPFLAKTPVAPLPIPSDAAADGAGSPWGTSQDAQHWRERTAAMLKRLQTNNHPLPAGLDLFPLTALIVADRLASSRPDERIADLNDPQTVLAKSSIPGQPDLPKGQTLVGHLLQVADLASAFHDLAAGRRRLGIPPETLPPSLTDLPNDGLYAWQGQALHFAQRSLRCDRPAFLILNAGTGSGKTRVALSLLATARSLVRITALLPLRSLTVQTRIAYRRLGLSEAQVAIRIGGAPIPHSPDEDIPPLPTDTPDIPSFYDTSSESFAFLQDQIDRLPSAIAKYLFTPADGLDHISRLVAVPILTSTIDLMMGVPAGDSLRALTAPIRLADTDLLLDEIDLLSPEDQACVHRLIRACAAYGGRVCIVSATLPPEMATSFAAFYADGVRIRHALGLLPDDQFDLLAINDAFPPWHTRLPAAEILPQPIPSADHAFHELYQILQQQTEKRTSDSRRKIAPLPIPSHSDIPHIVDTIRAALPQFLQSHHTLLPCGRKLSIGFVRLGTIERVLLTAHSLSQNEHILHAPQAKLRVLAYHSNLSVPIRTEIEHLLDEGLLRHPDLPPPIIHFPPIQDALNQTPPNGTLVLLIVCTSILETGRDHDYDWGILEPESSRSLIQAAGRIRRHRYHPLPSDSPPNLLIFTHPFGSFPYAFPGPLTRHPLLKFSETTRKTLESLNALKALNFPPTPTELSVAHIAVSPLATAEREIRLAFLDDCQKINSLCWPISSYLPLQHHLVAGQRDPTAWLAHGTKIRRFRRSLPQTLDVEIWYNATQEIWQARCPHRPHDIVSLQWIPLSPGPAFLSLREPTVDAFPTQDLPLQISWYDKNKIGRIVSFPIEGHPWLGWKIS